MATLVDGLPFPDFATSLPTADRASLVGLSDAKIRLWTIAKADEYRRFSLALLSIHNSIAPINRLPFEILSKIFEGCWADRDSLRLAHVCSRWRSVLLKTSGFWADAVDDVEFSLENHSLQYLDATLMRSAPLYIEPQFFGFSHDIHRHLAPHSRRIVFLQVTIVDYDHLLALWDGLDSGMPSLHTLIVSVGEDDDDWDHHIGIRHLSSTALPRLTRLTTPAGLFRCAAVPSLKHLTLKPSPREGIINDVGHYDSFCQSLEICPNLETLKLLFVAPDDVPTKTVSLPVLQYLRIKGGATYCSHMLSCLSFPKTTRVHCTDIGVGVERGLRATLPSDSDSLLSLTSDIDRIVVQAEIDRSSYRYTASVHGYAHDEPLLRVECSPLRHSDLSVFHRRARVTHLEVYDIQRIPFYAFPHLVAVTICGRYAADVLGGLAAKDEVDGPVCPDLKTLSVHFGFAAHPVPLGTALRSGSNLAWVNAHLREQCARIERVLSRRAQIGCRLMELEFGCVEAGRIDEHECTHDVMSADDGSWRSVMDPLEKLVDGPVTFTGYHFFAQPSM